MQNCVFLISYKCFVRNLHIWIDVFFANLQDSVVGSVCHKTLFLVVPSFYSVMAFEKLDLRDVISLGGTKEDFKMLNDMEHRKKHSAKALKDDFNVSP